MLLRCVQAEKFRSKAQKADTWRVPGQYCRYLYYLGTIRAIQLEYTEAKEVLQQASRKAPTCAHGFRVACNKWLILVRGAWLVSVHWGGVDCGLAREMHPPDCAALQHAHSSCAIWLQDHNVDSPDLVQATAA
jgi:hypothetical protein